MPSGKVHDQITVIAALGAAPVWWYASPPPKDLVAGAALIGATLFSGMMLSPDLDLDSSVYRRWGPLRFLWWPYQKLVPHRSQISHSVLLGPIIRVLYFVVVTWTLWRIGSWAGSLFVSFDRNAWSERYAASLLDLYENRPQAVLMLLVGLFLGAGVHCGADLFVSAAKKRRRKRRA